MDQATAILEDLKKSADSTQLNRITDVGSVRTVRVQSRSDFVRPVIGLVLVLGVCWVVAASAAPMFVVLPVLAGLGFCWITYDLWTRRNDLLLAAEHGLIVRRQGRLLVLLFSEGLWFAIAFPPRFRDVWRARAAGAQLLYWVVLDTSHAFLFAAECDRSKSQRAVVLSRFGDSGDGIHNIVQSLEMGMAAFERRRSVGHDPAFCDGHADVG